MAIVNLRVTEKTLLKRLREAAQSSSNVVFIPEPNKGSMAGMMTWQQAMSCLREGDIVGKPTPNAHGHWELQVQRYAANHMFNLRAIAECTGARVTRIYVFLTAESL